MSDYKPPYTITNKILTLSNNIVELLTELKHIKKELNTPKLRKKNRIKSITGTLQIEGNSFDLEKVTNLINGKTVLGTMREIEEVKGAIAAYDYLETYNYKNEKDLLKAHKFLMQNLLSNAGAYRHSNVGVGGADGVTHVAPPPNMVPELMGELFTWLNTTDDNLLIASCVFHYEFEFIHPFNDGNGRVGRLWQSVILNQYKNVFGSIPIESVVRENQEAYYQALEDAGSVGESTPFIEFMLGIILTTLEQTKKENVPKNVPKNVPLKRLDKVLKIIAKNRDITILELSAQLNVTDKTIKRDIAKLKDENKLIRVGSLKSGHWEIVNEV
ncbi:MAG: Fic family protein [Campylobacterota bacterium]|nr:Fic family protein [Campylobacterota bacterium]